MKVGGQGKDKMTFYDDFRECNSDILQKRTELPLFSKKDVESGGSKNKYKMQTNVVSLLDTIYLISSNKSFLHMRTREAL